MNNGVTCLFRSPQASFSSDTYTILQKHDTLFMDLREMNGIFTFVHISEYKSLSKLPCFVFNVLLYSQTKQANVSGESFYLKVLIAVSIRKILGFFKIREFN